MEKLKSLEICRNGFDFIESTDVSLYLITKKLNENLIIMFHGLGDNKESYKILAKNMKLPQTAVLVINGYEALPEWVVEKGFFWFPCQFPGLEDCNFYFFNFQVFEKDVNEHFLDNIINNIEKLISFLETANFKRSRIFFFGFSQGAALCSLYLLNSKDKFGGLVAISTSCMGPVRQFSLKSSIKKDIPLYFSHGSLDDKVSSTEASKNVILFLTYHSISILLNTLIQKIQFLKFIKRNIK